MLAAIREAKLIQQDPAPDVRVESHDEKGITYAIRYWVPRFERGADCRDEAYRLIDAALRKAELAPPYLAAVQTRSDDSATSVRNGKGANGKATGFAPGLFPAIGAVSG